MADRLLGLAANWLGKELEGVGKEGGKYTISIFPCTMQHRYF